MKREYIPLEEATTIPVLPKEQRVKFRNIDEAFEAGWKTCHEEGELVKRLRHDSESRALMAQAADAIEGLTAIAESYERSMEAWADTAAAAVEQIPRWIPATEAPALK